MADPQFLGLDASTQALKASLLSSNLDVLNEIAVNFDADLPHYNTRGGVLHGPQGSGEVFSPVMMVVEAMDLLFERIKEAGWDLSQIRGAAAAGQQHASVYWSRQSSALLSSPDPSQALAVQIPHAFSRSVIPNWQDSSTTPECRALEAAFGGPDGLARATGSKAHERFTGAQIMRFKRVDPEAYESTDRISLVSSFMTTLLCLDGEVKGIDESDACGMNLWTMDTKERGWNKKALEAIAGKGAAELERKLGKVETDGGKVVGKIGKWFVERYGFDPECCVFPGTGDNPATFLSLTLLPNEGLISLGTSDVVLVSTDNYNPHPEYHAFFHPAQIAPPSVQDSEEGQHTAMRYFNMLVYKNGSLAREHVRNVYYGESWDSFNSAVEKGRPKSAADLPGQAAFWWLLPDIIPDGAHGTFKYISERSGAEISDAASAKLVSEFPDPTTNALVILESQLLNYRSRSSAILDSATSGALLSRVYATGGAAKNQTIVSLMADVLGAPVCKNVDYDPKTKTWGDANWNACSVGMAYKAKWGWERHAARGERKVISFDDVVRECRMRRAKVRGNVCGQVNMDEEGIRVVAAPGEGAGAYEKSAEWWKALERKALERRTLEDK